MKNRQSLDWDFIIDAWGWMLRGASVLSALASLMVFGFLIFVFLNSKRAWPEAPLELLVVLVVTLAIAFGLHLSAKKLNNKKGALLRRLNSSF